MLRDNKVYSGFFSHDYILTFSIEDEANRARLVELCAGPWQGDQVVPNTWEVSNDLSPDQMERAILDLMGEHDHAAYYYRSDAKRLFRVMLG
jgi:tRNA U38,U39,U40 pseudouridine synthase TruA